MTPPDPPTYRVYVLCHNCGERQTVKIPLGVPVSEKSCPDCGCKTLRR